LNALKSFATKLNEAVQLIEGIWLSLEVPSKCH